MPTVRLLRNYRLFTAISDSKTVLDIGGEDSQLLMIHSGTLTNFQMNKDCSGGMGAMIEAIANRLGVDITEVGRIALDSNEPCHATGQVRHILPERGGVAVKQGSA